MWSKSRIYADAVKAVPVYEFLTWARNLHNASELPSWPPYDSRWLAYKFPSPLSIIYSEAIKLPFLHCFEAKVKNNGMSQEAALLACVREVRYVREDFWGFRNEVSCVAPQEVMNAHLAVQRALSELSAAESAYKFYRLNSNSMQNPMQNLMQNPMSNIHLVRLKRAEVQVIYEIHQFLNVAFKPVCAPLPTDVNSLEKATPQIAPSQVPVESSESKSQVPAESSKSKSQVPVESSKSKAQVPYLPSMVQFFKSMEVKSKQMQLDDKFYPRFPRKDDEENKPK